MSYSQNSLKNVVIMGISFIIVVEVILTYLIKGNC